MHNQWHWYWLKQRDWHWFYCFLDYLKAWDDHCLSSFLTDELNKLRMQRISDYSIVSVNDCLQRLDFFQDERNIESKIVDRDCKNRQEDDS